MVVAAATVLTLAVSACASGSAKDAPAHPIGAASTTAARARTTPSAAGASGPALAIGSRAVPAAAIARAIDRLYAGHPALSSYVVQSTTYTTDSRGVVLHACTTGGSAATSEQVESARLVACAPLIFYLHSYGTQDHVPQATAIADMLFTFASRDILGPVDAASDLASLLRTWGIVVDTTGAPGATHALSRTLSGLLAQIRRSMLSKGSVRVTISGYQQHGQALEERIVDDLGDGTSRQTITEPDAHAEIAVTPTTAFLSGTPTGLTKLIGLTSAAARKAGSRWIEVSQGTEEYADLAAEDTIAALPSTILPTATDAVTLTRTGRPGRRIDVLTWSAPGTGTTAAPTERLEVTPGASALPIDGTTTAGEDLQVVSFSNWGEPVTALAPPRSDVIPYTTVTSK